MARTEEQDVQQLLDEMATKLKLINLDALRASNFSDSNIDDLKDLHEMVMSKSHFSPREMEAIVEEIGSLKKRK